MSCDNLNQLPDEEDGYQRQYLGSDEWEPTESTLHYRDGEWYLHLCFRKPKQNADRPGQNLEYILVDDEKTSRERVALAHEEIESYDTSYYETQLATAVESLLSPLGWDRSRIRRKIAETRVPELKRS